MPRLNTWAHLEENTRQRALQVEKQQRTVHVKQANKIYISSTDRAKKSHSLEILRPFPFSFNITGTKYQRAQVKANGCKV